MTNQEKINAAKAYLGPQWVGHPAYKGDPRHSLLPEICAQARQPYLLAVSSAARCAREVNPAFIQATH